MIITDNDSGSLNNVRHEVADIIKIMMCINKTALRNIYSAHQLDTVEVSSGYFCTWGESFDSNFAKYWLVDKNMWYMILSEIEATFDKQE